MTVLTTTLRSGLINNLFRTAAFPKPTALYVGLISAVANIKTGAVTELSGGAYDRVICSPSDATWSAADTNGKTSNLVALTFPTATVAWLTATHFGLWDAASGGNLLICSTLTTPRTVTLNTTPVFGIGTLEVQLDD
jgi:hypothetical protein